MGKFSRGGLAAVALALMPMLAAHSADERQSLEELRNTVVNLLQALVDQGVISREKAEQMVKAAQAKAAANAAATAKADEGAVRVPYVPQIVRDEIAKQVADQVKPAVVAGVVQEAKTEKWGVPGALADWLTRTRISGGVTLREEDILYGKNNVTNAQNQQFFFYPNWYGINQAGGVYRAGINALENTSEDRARFRGRAQLAVDADLSDAVTAGFRIVTGNTSDLVSHTQTLDGTAPYQFGLDELYVRYDGRDEDRFPWLSVVAGRFLNPYGTPTDLIFHKDLTFTGMAATARLAFGDGTADRSHLFFTVGAHPLQEVALSGQDKWLGGAQLGLNLRWDEGPRVRLAAGFFDYLNVTGRLNPPDGTIFNYTAPTFLRQGNTYYDIANSSDPTVNLFALAAKYRLANVTAGLEIPVGRYTFGWNADAVRNLAFDSADVSSRVGHYVAARTKGYQTEVGFGDSAVRKAGAWRAVLGYRYLQADAVIDAYTDSDFHFGGTDATGYYFAGEVGLANNVWMRLRYLSSNAIDGLTLGIDTVQLDLNTRF